MDTALKQRLIGAMVLVAMAVIFLPMLIKGPAPESGLSDVSLDLPDAPSGEFQTRELPLVTPGNTPRRGALGMTSRGADDGHLPMVDTTTTGTGNPVTRSGDNAGANGGMLPAATAGGDYAVSFGSYASRADAARVVAALTSSQLPGYQETVSARGARSLYRVRIGPYASRAQAEAARLRAGHVRDDVGARVLVLNADAPQPARAATPGSQPAAAATATVSPPAKPAAGQPADSGLADTRAAISKPATTKPAPAKPLVTAPASAARPPVLSASAAKPVVTAPSVAPAPPAAADVGFAVQLGAFGSAADANKLRDRAVGAGFNAFVQDVRTDKGVLSRVRVGPVLGRAAADQLRAQVSAKLGISGIVQSHP